MAYYEKRQPAPPNQYALPGTVTLWQTAEHDIEKLKVIFRSFYSVGQMELNLLTLRDKGTIPGMSQSEREARITAFKDLLGLTERERILKLAQEKEDKRKANKRSKK